MDRKGLLKPSQLAPVMAVITAAECCPATEDQCSRFTQMFDLDGNGLLQQEEFVDFARFLCTLGFLHTSYGKDAAAEVMRILSDSRGIDDLLELMAMGGITCSKSCPTCQAGLLRNLKNCILSSWH